MTDRVRPISIAVAALGGQGGGVLAQWIVDLAEANGYLAQSTSVPGVAQRTGATIYYLEIFPRAEAERAGKDPVLALMPVSGDVDIVIASELMEAGRAIMRGFVSPDLTTLIASSHRVYAIGEKEAMGDGRADDAEVREAARKAAKRLVLFDMQAAAEDTGSVISAVLFGALAGSGALPFPREAYEQTIRDTGKAVEANLAGFARGFEGAQREPETDVPSATPAPAPRLSDAEFAARVNALPGPVRETAAYGVARLVDYQDRRYADLYLDRLEALAANASGANDPDHRLLKEAARYLALWMGFEDVIRVADLKTRRERMEKVREEVRARPDQFFYTVEFFHPRYEEFCDTLPAPLGRALMNADWLRKLTKPLFSEGRLIQTAKLSGFLPLYFLSKLRRIRRSTLRFKRENAQIEAWLAKVSQLAPENYALGVEVAQLPRLIKGYGETHERGFDRYQRIMARVDDLMSKDDGAERLRNLREAALADEEGRTFAKAIGAEAA
ncbi:MAG: indolepyruvate oxidoreductase subunit beta family protein [Alphaproteobacteria bacterium]|nr:MAG: indolepyruvate oxidoreductase subunit beta family protein [Alphaproteobacteria bacterium]